MIAEDRPYWWIKETTTFSDFNKPTLRQTNLTCETTPGCPSGHSIAAAAVLYVICTEIINYLSQKRRSVCL